MPTGTSAKSDIAEKGGGVDRRPCPSSVRIIESDLSGAAYLG
jgi:hypothetical protein